MKRLFLITLVSLIIGVICLPTAAQDDDDRAAIAMQYPRIEGSTSALPLQQVIACHIYDIPWVWSYNDFESIFYITAGLHRDQLSDFQRLRGMNFINYMTHSGTHEAYLSLITDSSDFILVARPPSRDELQAAKEAGVEFDVQPVALDAFVFLAHIDNSLKSVTVEDMRAVYTGEITSWNDLGVTASIVDDASNPITPYTRNANSGSQELMDKFVMQGQTMIDAPDLMQMSMMGPINAIKHNPLGLGYSVFFYASVIQPDIQIKLLGINGVIPTSATIRDESYPLIESVYAVVRADLPATSPAVRLRDWLLTPAGQAAVEASGYVPLPQ